MNKKLSTLLTIVGVFGVIFALVYGGYYLYLVNKGLGGSSKQELAIMQIGKALLITELEKPYSALTKDRVSLTLAGVSSSDNCNFWTFEYVIEKCRFASLSVTRFDESERTKILELVEYIAGALAKPCDYVYLLETENQFKVKADLECGNSVFTYRMILQARASHFVENSNGSGYYTNSLIYSKSIRGEI